MAVTGIRPAKTQYIRLPDGKLWPVATILATPHAYSFSTPYNSHTYPFWAYSLITVLSTAP